eukprot:6104110-Pleurochrysis_carterae.AAC.2
MAARSSTSHRATSAAAMRPARTCRMIGVPNIAAITRVVTSGRPSPARGGTTSHSTTSGGTKRAVAKYGSASVSQSRTTERSRQRQRCCRPAASASASSVAVKMGSR